MWVEKLRRQMVRENRIYIIPSGQGFLFLFAIVVQILVAATYNNNLIFALGFFMFAVFVVSMLQTHYNIKGVRLQMLSAGEGFAGDPIPLHFQLVQKRARFKRNLEIRTKSKTMTTVRRLRENLAPSERQKTCQIDVVCAQRGVYNLPDIILETYFPLGLFRAWKVFRFPVKVTVYPRPRGLGLLEPSPYQAGTDTQGHRSSPDGDFGELKKYLMGESYHQIAWKHYARTGELFTKVHWGDDHRHYKIPWVRPGVRDVEGELEMISGYIQSAMDENATFEMATDTRMFEPGQGLEHAKACWRELASYRRPA